jgi:nitroimidazol reductase NimA-like FMN-containing flavoprotein (pyridoxamine 5'-phosphate oxidase superfamily)
VPTRDGRTYVVPVTYAFDDLDVYAHSAVGTKIRMMRDNPSVCFEVDHLDDLSNWRSMIAWGHFEELSGQEAERGMGILLGRLAPLMVSETVGRPGPQTGHGDARSAGQVVAFRIAIDEMSGRFERRRPLPGSGPLGTAWLTPASSVTGRPATARVARCRRRVRTA